MLCASGKDGVGTMKMQQGSRSPFVLCVVVQTVIFGLGNVITKFAYESVTPLWCMVLRFGLALAAFALVFGPRMVRELRGVKLADWAPAAVCLAVGYIACNLALDVTTATNVGFLVALPVVFAPFIAQVVRRVRYPRAMIPFQVAVVGGLYLLCCNGGSFSFGAGEALSLLSSAAIAGSLVFGEKGLEKLSAPTIAGTQILAAFVLSLAAALAAEPVVDVAAIEPAAWGVIVFLAILSTCVTFALQNVALTGLSSSTVSLLLTGEPVFTALFSMALLGEFLSIGGWVGAGVILVAVVGATLVEGCDGNTEAPLSAGMERLVSRLASDSNAR